MLMRHTSTSRNKNCRSRRTLTFLYFAFLGTSSSVVAQVDTPSHCHNLTQIQWLLGQWQTEDGEMREHWHRSSDSTFTGVGDLRKDGHWQNQETLLIAAMDKAIYYIAKPKSNPKPVVFTLTACSNSLARFQNPEHDFPNNIEYRLVAPNKVTVDVSDNRGKGFTLEYIKPKLN